MAARQHLASELRDAVRARPSLGLYLAALLLLPVTNLTPLGVLSERSGWTDLLVAAATMAWLLETRLSLHGAGLGRLRGPVAALAAFLVLSGLSAALAADDRREAAVNVLLAAELVALALLTADHGRSRCGRNAIVLAVAAGAVVTVVLAILGVLLAVVGLDTSLAGPYGEELVAGSSLRASAGFHSPPLLASYCIVAAAIVAMGSYLPARLRRSIEVALGVVVVLTVSRAILGFFVAFVIRQAAAHRSRKGTAVAVAAAVLAVAAMVALSVWRVQIDPERPSDVLREAPEPANRRTALTTSLDTLVADPLLGSGPGSLPGMDRGVPVRAHFTPLNVAATTGVPALVALATALALLWVRRGRPTDVALWSGFAGVAIDALGQDVEHFRHLWILIGLAAASAAVGTDERAEVAAVPS